MKITAIVLATAAAAAPANTQETRVILSPEDAARCQAQGGCGIVSRVWLQRRLQQAYEAGKAECKGGT